jgi:hypothetical protein
VVKVAETHTLYLRINCIMKNSTQMPIVFQVILIYLGNVNLSEQLYESVYVFSVLKMMKH